MAIQIKDAGILMNEARSEAGVFRVGAFENTLSDQSTTSGIPLPPHTLTAS